MFRHVAQGGAPNFSFAADISININLNYKGVRPPHIFGEHIRDGRENKEIKKLKVKELYAPVSPPPLKK